MPRSAQLRASGSDAGLDISVAVNLSARSLHDEKLPEMIAALLRQVARRPAPAHARDHRERA